MKSRALMPIVAAVAVAAGAFALLAALAPTWMPTLVRVVAAYDIAVVSLLAWYASLVVRSTPQETKALASEEDPGRNAVFWIAISAVVFGIVAAFNVLGHGPHNLPYAQELSIDGLAFAAVALGWLLIHTIFIFRYAHLYHRAGSGAAPKDPGLNFPGGADLAFMDFAYFSLVVGMTFQVSDVQVTSRSVRSVVLLQGLIAFFYYTTLVALVVNLVSGLLR